MTKKYKIVVTRWDPVDITMEITCENAINAKSIAVSNVKSLSPREDINVIGSTFNKRHYRTTVQNIKRVKD